MTILKKSKVKIVGLMNIILTMFLLTKITFWENRTKMAKCWIKKKILILQIKKKINR